jgi:hypothetical protein
MADKHQVSKGGLVEFSDDVSRHIRPLSIKQLRKFVKIIEKMGDTTDATTMTDEDIDHMVDAAEVILAKVDPNLVADRDQLEDVVDLDAFNQMMSIAMGNASPEG